MRLRNRQTGKVYTLSDDLYIEYTQGGKIELRVIIPGGSMSNYYDSLAELYEEWGDYKPKEPLIKDEKIRKFVQDWASFNNIKKADIARLHGEDSWYRVRGEDEVGGFWNIEIHAPYPETISSIYDGCMVTITELCGEVGK